MELEGVTVEAEGATAKLADRDAAALSDTELTSTANRKYPLRNRQSPKTFTYDWDSPVPLLDGSRVPIVVQLGWVYGITGTQEVKLNQIRVLCWTLHQNLWVMFCFCFNKSTRHS